MQCALGTRLWGRLPALLSLARHAYHCRFFHLFWWYILPQKPPWSQFPVESGPMQVSPGPSLAGYPFPENLIWDNLQNIPFSLLMQTSSWYHLGRDSYLQAFFAWLITLKCPSVSASFIQIFPFFSSPSLRSTSFRMFSLIIMDCILLKKKNLYCVPCFTLFHNLVPETRNVTVDKDIKVTVLIYATYEEGQSNNTKNNDQGNVKSVLECCEEKYTVCVWIWE